MLKPIVMIGLSRRLSLVATLSTLLLSTLTPLSASAQSRDSVLQRLENLERQLAVVNRGGNPNDAPSHYAAGGAQAGIRVTELEEELRELRGRLEELDHQQQRVAEQFDRLQQDIDARIMTLEERMPAVAPPVIGGYEPLQEAPVAAQPAPVAQQAPIAAPAPVASERFPDAREHYDAAFKSLNQSNYQQASSLFASFLATYPDDVLVGNAYYWLGETYYVQQQYGQAAEQFRLGFEKMPEGPKAPDNLLKLGMSLSALNRRDEACLVLAQLMKKYGGQSQVIERKATMERARLQCAQ